MPSQLTAFAVQSLRDEGQHPYGYEWQTVFNGEQVVAIKQHHTWTYHNGHLITGICIPGITLYRPKKIGAAEIEVDTTTPNQDLAWYDNGAPTDWTLIAGCAFALIALISLFLYGLRRLKG